MTLFAPPTGVKAAPGDSGNAQAADVKRPPRWSVRNWPVRWKVLAIALVPMVLAMVFGGLRIAGAMTDASQLRRAADRAEMIPAITDYMSALDAALVAGSSGGDVAAAQKDYENRKYALRSRLAGADGDIRSGVATLLDGGQGLLDQASSHSIAVRDLVTSYAPILLTAEDAINGSVRIDSERIRAETAGLSRAVGARGQMTMQELLVNRGGELPEPSLRTAMITLAGTEPSTLFGMSEVLGVDSPDAKKLQQQLVTRMAILSDPEAPLAANADVLQSIQTTDRIANQVITDTSGSVTTAVEDQAADRRTAAIRDTVVVLAALAIAVAVVLAVARSLVRPLRRLRDGALKVAHTDLENGIARVRAGGAGADQDPAPLPVHTTEEVGQVAHAVDELHTQALLLAGDEARLRLLVNDMFETMSRRNRSLVDQQLSLIDRLERDEQDPDRLDSLFRLDHLAARMRRNGANLLVLADAQSTHDQGRSMPLSAVIDAAASEVEDYRRVDTAAVPEATVAGAAVGDTVHLLAELIDNALRYSPPAAPVRVSARQARDAGVLVEIVDTGLGMTDADLRIANMRLGVGGEVSPENARHMGLFVAGQLARRHRIRVRLRVTAPQQRASGITAEVYLPPTLLVGAAGPAGLTQRGTPPPPMPMPARAAHPQRPEPARAAQHDRNGTAVSPLPQRNPGSSGIAGAPAAPRRAPSLPAETAAEDLIYQGMLSEWLVDPHQLAHSPDLDWKSVWDHGWSVAAEAEQVPVAAHTEQGLPVRDPGARLVPGAAVADPAPQAGRREPQHSAPERDPDAVRASISSHFGGVRAGRSHARHASPGPER